MMNQEVKEALCDLLFGPNQKIIVGEMNPHSRPCFQRSGFSCAPSSGPAPQCDLELSRYPPPSIHPELKM
ncbi:Hypothetical protein SMAX5B_009309 [Scophthalmus maximus]|uniref:Uncharacterized protein n=1 Tax=Scophthalmus maximus TaxID=52904 RepID=A0A2U9CA75_SCOMX|nr:Hypothetical protein SMAX5B_009309 [Scophthalmus maximus]